MFVQGDQDDYTKEDVAYEHAETVVGAIVKRLQHEKFIYKNYLDFDSIRIEPIMYISGVDSAYGYELKMKLGLPANEVFC